VLQAEAGMDAGPVWASREFLLRAASKADVYRNETTAGALAAVREALARVPEWRAGRWQPRPLAHIPAARGRLRPLMRQAERALDWARMGSAEILARIRAADFWSNGIHLNTIEAAPSPADESWANIEAIDDVCLALLGLTDRLTVAALRGNAGAGGCFLARACRPRVGARRRDDEPALQEHGQPLRLGILDLPAAAPGRRGGRARHHAQPPAADGAREAAARDRLQTMPAAGGPASHRDVARGACATLAATRGSPRARRQARRRAADEAAKPLAAYRAAELLDMMRRNFYGFDPSYHVARYHFVLKSPQSWTPRHLARHRELGWPHRPRRR
jgi:putative two-component system hydrogenase maturation factor HypX/HoxX